MRYLIWTILFFSPILNFAQTLETFAGTGIPGLLNGPADEARFSGPEQTAVDQEGNVYVCDLFNHVIRKIDLNGEVTTFAGSGIEGDQLGQKETAQFYKPSGITFDDSGNLYVVDKNNNKIKVIRPNGMVEWVAGSGQAGYADGSVESAMFNQPTYICIDEFNNLYLAGNNDNRIRKIDLSTQTVSTFAGSGIQALQDGVGTSASFFLPQGIAIDQDNNIYVGDRNNNAIRKITPDQVVTTLAGNGGAGFADGPGEQAKFNGPKGLTVDSAGNVYVADRLNFVVRKIDTEGVVSTIAGTPGISGYLDGEYSTGNLIGRAVNVICFQDQSLLVSDWTNETIRKLLPNPFTETEELELPPNKTVKISPNPCSDILRIEGQLGEQFQITLSNINGQVLKQEENTTSIHLNGFLPGIYFLQILGENYLNVEKVVIK
ncbi:MAG: T9SS type A sorting domain-containing protein [Chitinophagales bacterium]|nr:T9SS type A sorting domain-containing protein [Chitinophagales bacterium]